MDDNTLIQRAVVGFFVALDGFDIEAALRIVGDDIEWIRESGTIRGREGVRRVLEARPRNRCTRHLVSNLVIDLLDEHTARARCDVVVYQGSTDSGLPLAVSGPSLLLTNEDNLVLGPNGWVIARKTPTTVIKFHS